MRLFSEKLLATLGSAGPIFVYSHFEKTALIKLADMLPDLAMDLYRLRDRLKDLLPLTRQHYYHPEMKCSWSLKAVLPTVAPDLSYDALEEVQHGIAAQVAYLEAIDPATSPARRQELTERLLEYCCLDTLGLVRLVQFLQQE